MNGKQHRLLPFTTLIILTDNNGSCELPLSQKEHLQYAMCAPGTSLKAVGVCTSSISPPGF